MNTQRNATSLSTNQIGPYAFTDSSQGTCQPPKKSVTASAESTTMLMYSAIWKSPQRMPEYSVWYPATSSVSASGRSNGGRDVSAIAPNMKTSSPTNCGMKNHTVCC